MGQHHQHPGQHGGDGRQMIAEHVQVDVRALPNVSGQHAADEARSEHRQQPRIVAELNAARPNDLAIIAHQRSEADDVKPSIFTSTI